MGDEAYVLPQTGDSDADFTTCSDAKETCRISLPLTENAGSSDTLTGHAEPACHSLATYP